ncbi:hypothetical protein R84981_000705 [Carnimonas sp. R-84981]|uniref:hypothetical protein n=1 Tax=Carnimonas bestiolae TaxID=3402172 RepID=UPI003EDC3804
MKALTENEVAMVVGAADSVPHSSGFLDSIAGGIVDGIVGASFGGLTGGANAGAASSGGVVGVGAIAQGVGAIAGIVLGGIQGVVYGAVAGYSNSDDYVYNTLKSMWDGEELPTKGLA